MNEDLDMHDLPLQLGKLAAHQFLPMLKQDGSVRGNSLVQEASNIQLPFMNAGSDVRLAVLQASRVLDDSSPSSSLAFSIFPFHQSTSSVQQLMARLPAREFADLATQQYFRALDWYLHPGERSFATREGRSFNLGGSKNRHSSVRFAESWLDNL